jgi:basic membrane protein A and related proteins
MKKFLVLFAIAFLTLGSLAACAPEAEVEEEPTGYEIALVTDVGTIDDKSFNQGAWEGVVEYAEENSISYKYYQPTEKSTDAYIAAIDLAVENGAKVIVTPGFLFEPAIFKAQDMHPDIKFVLLDGFPQDGTYTEFRIEDNVYSVFYAEEQVGFLAGYAAVKEGFTNLGFMGGMAVPAVVRFGYGFVQGANYAAAELGVNVTLKYKYLGGFGPTPEYQTEAATWFQGGTEVIFAAAGGAGNSVMAAAEANNGKVIGVDIDQSAESTTVITSAMKGLGISVYDALADFYAGSFKGGESVFLGVDVNGVSLPEDFSRFATFTKADYDAIFAKLVADTDGIRANIKKDTDVNAASELPVTNVTVEVIG